MFFLVAALVLITLAILSYVLKLKLQFIVEISPGKKEMNLSLSVAGKRLAFYLIKLQSLEKGLFRLKYFKDSILQDIFELKDIVKTIKKKEKPKRSKEFAEILDLFLDKKKMVVEKLSLAIDIGLENAMAAAMLHGTVTSAVNAGLARLYHLKGVPNETNVHIRPCFDKRLFNLNFEAVLSVRLYIILFVWIKTRIKKAGEKNSPHFIKEKNGLNNAA